MIRSMSSQLPQSEGKRGSGYTVQLFQTIVLPHCPFATGKLKFSVSTMQVSGKELSGGTTVSVGSTSTSVSIAVEVM